MNNSHTVLDFLNLINNVLENTIDGVILDPKDIFIAAILPAKDNENHTADDFKEIYEFELYDIDINVLKMRAKSCEYGVSHAAPTVASFISLVDECKDFLLDYNIHICCEDENGNTTTYHLGEYMCIHYTMVGENPYIIIPLEKCINEAPNIRHVEISNITQQLGILS